MPSCHWASVVPSMSDVGRLSADGDHARVVDADVEPVGDAERSRYDPVGRAGLHQVGHDADGGVAEGGELGGAFVHAVGGGAEHHGGAVGGERLRCHETDALVVARAGDECDLADEAVEEAHCVKCSTAS